MTTFALVHGAWHDAGCWDQLILELHSLGHETIAMDLPCEDPSATFVDYADVVLSSLNDIDDDVVLVGHSLAGHTIPLVAAKRSVRSLVYVCALAPVPGRSFVEQMRDEPTMLIAGYELGMEIDGLGRRAWVDEKRARHTFYEDCPDDVAAQAFTRLRPQSPAPYVEACPLQSLPAVPATYVLCSEDRLVNPDWSRRIARERLGAAVIELPGSHSPFLSRPRALAGVLHTGLSP